MAGTAARGKHDEPFRSLDADSDSDDADDDDAADYQGTGCISVLIYTCTIHTIITIIYRKQAWGTAFPNISSSPSVHPPVYPSINRTPPPTSHVWGGEALPNPHYPPAPALSTAIRGVCGMRGAGCSRVQNHGLPSRPPVSSRPPLTLSGGANGQSQSHLGRGWSGETLPCVSSDASRRTKPKTGRDGMHCHAPSLALPAASAVCCGLQRSID